MLGAIFDKYSTAQRLNALGFLKDEHAKGDTHLMHLAAALTDYQKHHGLPVCGDLDGATERHLCLCRTCRFPDRMMMATGDGLAKWPDGVTITWVIENVPDCLKRADAEAAYLQATRAWMSVCGVQFSPVTNGKTAKLTVRFDGIDGPGRVLAWSDLPDGSGADRIQRFDVEENWVLSETPDISEIDFLRVATHELGHVIGIGHIGGGNLLQPMYDLTIRSPQAGDIAEAQARYGPPAAPKGKTTRR